MRTYRKYLVVTNNPFPKQALPPEVAVRFLAGQTLRDVLVAARDLVYQGHALHSHPLSGSVKPNETPYKSIVLSQTPHVFSQEECGIIANGLALCDSFPAQNRSYTELQLRDFQIIDYTLLCGALELDPTAGIGMIINN